ncbi:MAG: hypothetical protein V3U60_11240 [Gammaproteobacteria bacterium]
METKSKYFNVRLTPTHHEALRRLAYDQRKTMTDILTKQIEVLAKKRKVWPE